MASQNPNHRSNTPSPLHNPRKNPFETIGRRSGIESRTGLSVHLGVHGRIISHTPKVAHKVTNRSARIRKNQTLLRLSTFPLLRGLSGLDPSAAGCRDSSDRETGGTVLGSTVTHCSGRVARGSSRMA